MTMLLLVTNLEKQAKKDASRCKTGITTRSGWKSKQRKMQVEAKLESQHVLNVDHLQGPQEHSQAPL